MGRANDAEALLVPAVPSGDPEVHWRLADVMVAMGRLRMRKCRCRSPDPVSRSFWENTCSRLQTTAPSSIRAVVTTRRGHLKLASINLANRPTLRAFEQAYATAVGAGKSDCASEILAAAEERWGDTAAFGVSSLATGRRSRDSLRIEHT